ncbi:hypothetical protein F4803DRAFT_319057 [Xylaria telfairii]|nr:hypothetical protein F4803DRAFT_319057 [Xylaria telfairii]
MSRCLSKRGVVVLISLPISAGSTLRRTVQSVLCTVLSKQCQGHRNIIFTFEQIWHLYLKSTNPLVFRPVQSEMLQRL